MIRQASLPYVKGDLKTLGIVLVKFSELAGRLEELLDVTLEVTKRTRGEYTNVYFNRRIQIAATATSQVADGDAPFCVYRVFHSRDCRRLWVTAITTTKSPSMM